MKKRRLDEALISSGRAKDRKEAFILVTEGRVRVNGQKAISPAQMVGADARVEVRKTARYVGRGALKLVSALDTFAVDVRGKICADIGAATGGFTQVLLERGAAKVYAIDTARGKLDLKIRREARVVVMERTDVRDVKKLPEPADIAVIDISLISLRDILPAAARLLARGGQIIALFKPQYETRDPRLLRHGVIHDNAAREALKNTFIAWLGKNKWRVAGEIISPIHGNKGNTEYLFHLQPQ